MIKPRVHDRFDVTEAAHDLATFTIVRLTGDIAMLDARIAADEHTIRFLRHEIQRLNESLKAQGRVLVELRAELAKCRSKIAQLPLEILRTIGAL